MARDYARNRSSRRNARYGEMTPRGGRRPSGQRRGSSGRSSLRSLLWMSSGIVFGLLIAGVLFMRSGHTLAPTPGPESTSTANEVPEKNQANKPTLSTKTQPHKKQAQVTEPHYDFYTTLSKDTVETSEPAPKEKINATTSKETLTPKSSIDKVESTPKEALTSTTSKEDITSKDDMDATEPPVKEKPKTTTATRYLVQVAAMNSYSDADHLKAQLTLLGYKVTINKKMYNGTQSFRVTMGPYPSSKAASAQQANLRKNKIESFIVPITNE